MNPNKNNTVDKALSPEEMTILSNIQSSIQELLAMSGQKSDTPLSDDSMEEAEKADLKPTGTEPKDEEYLKEKGKVKKEITSTPGDGPDAMSSAEDQIDEQHTETTKENIDEVAKALISAINLAMKSKKDVKKNANPLLQVMSELTEAVKKNTADIETMSNAVAKVLDGLGVSEQIQIAQKSLVNSNSKPIVNADNDASLSWLKDIIQKAQNGENGNDKNITKTTYQKNQDVINKNLTNVNVLKAFTGAGK